MLDAEHVVIADVGQFRAELRPPLLTMAIAESDVVPGALLVAIARYRLEHAVFPGDGLIDPGVLGMHVID